MQGRAYTMVRSAAARGARGRAARSPAAPRVTGHRACGGHRRAAARRPQDIGHALSTLIVLHGVLVNQSCLRLHAETGRSRDTGIEDPQMRAATAATLATLLMLATATQARLREELIDLPVEVTDAYGKVLRQTIKVTVFSDTANPAPAPVLVINHGRPAEPGARAGLGRARYDQASRFFVGQGFVVAVPTRIGYGETGGEDVEDTGGCGKKNYAPGYAAAAQQTLAVLDAMRQRTDTDKDRAVVVGESFGGATAASLAALNPRGVRAAINFGGGGGGDPKTQPQQPCEPKQLEYMFRTHGRTARVPMLWLYAENDMFFGPRYPREWFEAYVGQGAPAQFIQYPPQGEDGHSLFTRFPEVWIPSVMAFLRAQGLVAAYRRANR